MDSKVIQIIDIQTNDHKTDYILRSDVLTQLLSTVEDKEVAIFSIAGPSRQGKSFFLSLMARYLSSNDWMANVSEPLIGFDWISSTEPQTSGIWLSKPFLVRQSNGKEIAVLLMDSQGVFDAYATHRDWSTIVGISLLTSSCLIFNVFNNLQEDILTVLQSFLEYGLEAVGSGQTSDEKPFQNLLFLIRDWNHRSIHNYGLNGGQDFLDKKLEINERQSHTSQNARQLIHKCFKDVSCCLMPDPGSQAKEDINFKGMLSELNPQFIQILNELLTNLLKPENVVTKRVDGNAITGRELIRYLEAYIEAFNSDEMPKPSDLIEATHKASDLNFINKLKDDFTTEMQIILSDRPFYPRNDITHEYNELSTQLMAQFSLKKKSTNDEIIAELSDLLSKYLRSAYDRIYEENESKRERTANDKIEELFELYTEQMNTEFASKKILNLNEFNNSAENIKTVFLNQFIEFCGNETELFANHYLKLKRQIESKENSIRAEVRHEMRKYYSTLVKESVLNYKLGFRKKIDSNEFLGEEDFDVFEDHLRRESEQK